MLFLSDASGYARACEVAVEAAWQAARLIRARIGEVRETDVQEKGTHDLVTKVDKDAQALILHRLQQAFPDHTVLAEEGADRGAMDALTDGYRWIVDPIDGTTNFTHGVPPFAVSIALQKEAALVVGVVLEIVHGELFTAVRGGGAFRNGVRIHVSRRAELARSLLATGFPYRAFGHVEQYQDVLAQFMQAARGVRRFGAASIDLAYVACGGFDGFFETGLNAWDVAAGTLLVEEAGGHVTDYRNTPNPLFTRQIVASNGLLHEALLHVLAPMRDVRL